VLATPTGRIKRMRRGEDVVVLAVIPPEEIVGADLRLVSRLRDVNKVAAGARRCRARKPVVRGRAARRGWRDLDSAKRESSPSE
jgi:hypothetical protein